MKASELTCMFDVDALPVPLDCSWTLIPQGIYSAGIMLTFFSLVEFLIAQTPWQIKGLLLCIAVNVLGAFTLVGMGLDMVLMNMPIELFPGCGFFYYGIQLTIVVFIATLCDLVLIWQRIMVKLLIKLTKEEFVHSVQWC